MQSEMLRILLGSFRQNKNKDEEEEMNTDDSSSSGGTEDGVDQEEEEGEDDLQEGETWVEWLKRTTGVLEDQLRKTGLEDWVLKE